LLLVLTVPLPAAAAPAQPETRPDREQAVAVLQPYAGETAAGGVDRSTLTGKVMCGYQGWFTAPGDGSGKGWSHYPRRGRFEPGSCNIDLWPDVSELEPSERFPTPFRHADGSMAEVFSAHNRATVLRHFRWMREYGIDGVFVQRFAVETFSPVALNHCNVVLDACREGANREGRAYAVMYDLSGLREGGIDRVIDDWKLLVDRMRVGRDEKDKAYLRHKGKPVVAVWGIGFNDGRRYTLAECAKLIDFLKNDPTYGNNTVMVGVPTYWRTLEADAVRDPALLDVIQKADIVSPWTVGRYTTPEQAARHAEKRWAPDQQWCREHDKDYLPVVFPGFSWHNMNPAPNRPLDQIPRRKGQFLWSQFAAAKRAGMTMIYVAMFDEMDEGTAIFKCTNDPPKGESSFVTFEGLPSDHYLWLTGMGGRLLRGEVSTSEEPPVRRAN
jgi:hypothetical protein